MKFLYKLSLRNEHEIRNDLPVRNSFVAADSMGDAVNGFVDTMSLVESVEFVSPLVVIPSKTESSKSFDSIPVHHVIVPDDSFYRVIFLDDDEVPFTAMVRAKDSNDALFRLKYYLGYAPTIDSCHFVDYLVL